MASSGILSRLPFARSIERDGEQFFQTGRMLVITLGMFIDAVKEMRFSGLERFYAPRFSGNSLGLKKPELESERDGISIWRFSSDNAVVDSQSAIAEWGKYMGSFDDVEEISLHLHRLELWKSPTSVIASVRFEHIGTPRDARRTCIDRAYFRTEWERNGSSLNLSSQRLISGERIYSDQPHFINVAGEAG